MHRFHRTRTLLAALVLALAGASLACAPAEPEPEADGAAAAAGTDASEVVAEIGGDPITSAELDEWIKQELFDREVASRSVGERFQVRSDALDRMLTERAIREEAERRDLAPEAVVADERSQLGAVSDEDVQEFYTRHEGRFRGASLEQMEPRIRAFLESEREKEARDRVRERAEVAVHLEPPRTRVPAEGPSRGPEDAAVTIVEFTDYQCPFCQRAEPTLQEIVERYPEDVRWVVRHLPLDNIHPRARAAAHAAVCAEKQERFWEFHETLFANQNALETEDLVGYAEELGLDVDAFTACLDDPATHARVEADTEDARKVGVSGTPAFFVNGILLTGAKPVDEFVRVIERELDRPRS